MTAVAVLTDEQLRAMLEEAAERGAERALARAGGGDVLDTTQAARLADVKPKTIREWVAAGRLRATREGRELRINRADLAQARAGDRPDPHQAGVEALKALRGGG